MIGRNVKQYCNEDIRLIENYLLAVSDETQTWDCHHRNEIMSDGSIHSAKWLIDNNLFYNRPANELIFLTHSEHRTLHNTGEKNPFYGKHLADEHKRKLIEACKGSRWMTNGSVTLRVNQNDIKTYISNGYRFGRK